jgi:hypothetical protein
MSKKIVALRSRSPKTPKTATVVPIRPRRRWGPVECAQRDLDIQAERMSAYLKGMRHLLEAWIDYEHGSTTP